MSHYRGNYDHQEERWNNIETTSTGAQTMLPPAFKISNAKKNRKKYWYKVQLGV